MKYRVLLLGAVALAVPGLVVGCNLVVDAGGYKVGTVESEAGLEDTSTATGDTGVPEGSTHSDAGTDAAPCSSGVLDLAKLQPTLQSCFLLRGCFPANGAAPTSSTVSQCVTYDDPARNAGLACSAVTNASCTDMGTCFGSGFDIGSDCAANEIASKCINNKAVSCGVDGTAGVDEYEDCNIVGGTCAAINLGADGGVIDGGTPNFAGCVVTTSSCSTPEDTSECSGNAFQYYCVGGRGFGQNCAARAETCETRGTDTTCYFHDTTCSGTTATCDAQTNVGTTCSYGYQESYDCTKSGLACTVASGDVYCLAPGCTPTTSCTPSCDADGHTIHLCIGAAPLTVDCKSYYSDPVAKTTFGECLDFGTSAAPDPVCTY